MAIGECNPYPADLIGSLECAGINSPWFSDVNILGLFILAFAFWLGFKTKSPAAMMYTFGMFLLVSTYFLFDIAWFRALIIGLIIFSGSQIAIALFKGPKNATQ